MMVDGMPFSVLWTVACMRNGVWPLSVNYAEYDPDMDMFHVGHAVPDGVAEPVVLKDGSRVRVFTVGYLRREIAEDA